jgi:ABC-2 type transport system ATP-binding protein
MSAPLPAGTDSHAIEVRGLVRQFKKGPRAVDGIDLHVAEGEIYGFLGPNGAGKSTTVKMLVTLLPPSGGTASVGGFDVVRQAASVRKVIGAALQEASLDPLLTAREHLILQSGLHGFSRSEAQTRGDHLLERVGLTAAQDRKVGGFSGGMKRRLDLALALVHSPRILFLDEPTTGLDPQSRAALWEEVSRLRREEGVTIFLTTQYLEEADYLADRIGIIDHGNIVAEGTPESLKAEIGRATVEVTPQRMDDRPQIEQLLARFGTPRTAGSAEAVAVQLSDRQGGLAEVVRALDAAGLPVANVQLHAPTLDDVFLAKTGRSLEGEGGEPVESEVEEEDAVVARSAPFATGASVVMAKELFLEARERLTGTHAALVQPTLFFREGPLAGTEVTVAGEMVLGREGADVIIRDPEVSRRHALLRFADRILTIEDLGSLNGTWVDGKRVATTILTPGNTVQMGKTVFEVRSGARTTA